MWINSDFFADISLSVRLMSAKKSHVAAGLTRAGRHNRN